MHTYEPEMFWLSENPGLNYIVKIIPIADRDPVGFEITVITFFPSLRSWYDKAVKRFRCSRLLAGTRTHTHTNTHASTVASSHTRTPRRTMTRRSNTRLLLVYTRRGGSGGSNSVKYLLPLMRTDQSNHDNNNNNNSPRNEIRNRAINRRESSALLL